MRGVLHSFLILVARIGRSEATDPVTQVVRIGRSEATDPATRVHPIVKRSDGSHHQGPSPYILRPAVILERDQHHPWNSWYRNHCDLRGRFWSLGRHRYAVVSLTRKAGVATTQNRCWSHLALQLRNAHYGNLDCGQSPLKYSAARLANVAHTERVGRPHMGMAVFYSTCIIHIRNRTRVRHTLCYPASCDLVSGVPGTRHCVRAISTLVGSRHVSRFWLFGKTKTFVTRADLENL